MSFLASAPLATTAISSKFALYFIAFLVSSVIAFAPPPLSLFSFTPIPPFPPTTTSTAPSLMPLSKNLISTPSKSAPFVLSVRVKTASVSLTALNCKVLKFEICPAVIMPR